MRKTRTVTGAASALGMLLLILDTKTALSGASEGLSLCIRTVIPSLFPFFVLSVLLTSSLSGMGIKVLRPLCRLFRIPRGAETILLVGFLGGYPVGAQSVSEEFRRGQLTADDARRMLAFCSNAGPAFLFGMAASLFPFPWMPWALWGVHILSAILVGILIPGGSNRSINPEAVKPMTVTAVMNRAIRVMATVCCWVILFRVVIAFLTRWLVWLLPAAAQVIISGILELSNGCISLCSIQNIGLRFVLCSGFLAFGGMCVMLQTLSVSAGVDTRLYFPGKVLQTVISIPVAMVVQTALPDQMNWDIPPSIPIFLLIAVIFPFFLIKMRNFSGNLSLVGV